MRAGYHVKLSQKIMKKKVVINVQSNNNACFVWSVVAALYPVERNAEQKSSYPHYTTVLNLQDIEFPVTVNQIKKFDRANDISINVYCLEKKNVVPIRLSESTGHNGHFAWIKNLSRLVSSQLNKKEHIKYICGTLPTNERVRRLPSEKDKWFEFNNYNRKELLPFVMSTYTFQHHEVFSIAYYIHFTYDETLSAYHSRRNVDCIANVKLAEEKNHIKLRFIDSYKFLSASLDKLASFLNKDKFKILKSKFQNEDNFNLITRKGIFLYEYIDCVDRLEYTCLPPRDSFHSSLTGDTVSKSDYAHAETVWKRFSIRTLGEYSDLYLKTNVLLLADIFENFRESCIKSYGLDPTYYYTLPGFTWDAMLKQTNIKFELLIDKDMAMFIERGIRGGVSVLRQIRAC
ncbi:hypothetical protein ACFW04_012231 [Cataglyphis niger]